MKFKVFIFLASLGIFQISAQTLERYSHGEPSPEEQQLLELANRARANPANEGKRLAEATDPNQKLGLDFFKVDKAKLKRDFALYPPRPPLSMNAELTKAARRHSNDMGKNNFQGHVGSDGSDTGRRIVESGFAPVEAANESVYSNYVFDLSFAHAGFQVDWGYGPGGVQPGLGHRDNIMNFRNTVFREVGMGVYTRTGEAASKYGKLAVAQEFGSRFTHPMFLVGVVYQDSNDNSICDPGEGLPGIRVTPSVGTYYAVTSKSGGYSIPFFASHEAATVTFSGKGLKADTVMSFSINGKNTKLDLKIGSSALPRVRFKVLDGVASERGASAEGDARIQLIRTGPTDLAMPVSISRTVAPGKNKASVTDYKLVKVAPSKLSGQSSGGKNFSVIIPAGRSTADFRIVALRDKVKEPIEKVVFTIEKESAYRPAAPFKATISIRD